MINLVQVRKVFNAGLANEFVALDGVDLTLGIGETTVFRGPSGSGKTTLLGLIGCMGRPTSGRIRVNGREITSLPERFLTAIRRQTFGFIFQNSNLVRGITVLENVMLPAYPLGEKHSSLSRRAMDLLDTFKMAGKAQCRIEWLSGGEAQRTAIARALINNPCIIIADEPTANLDTKLSQEFLSIMGRLKSEGRTILIASHDPIVYESKLADRIVNIRDGRIERAAA